MFINDKIIFIEQPKKGSTHIRKLLSQILDGELIGKHNKVSSDLLNNRRKIIGSIRNPWERYLSLWAFGCRGMGGVHQNTTNSHNNYRVLSVRGNNSLNERTPDSLFQDRIAFRKDLYVDIDDAERFRRWLYLSQDKNYRGDIDLEYVNFPLSEFAGLLTYRYLDLFCNGDLVRLHHLEQLKIFIDQNGIVDYFIRNEFLEDDLIAVLSKCGEHISQLNRQVIYCTDKSNVSLRKVSTRYYYDTDTIEPIRQREQFVIEKFGYQPPS